MTLPGPAKDGHTSVGHRGGVVSLVIWTGVASVGGLVSFSADVIKCFDKINLRENGCVPTHISRVESTMARAA